MQEKTLYGICFGFIFGVLLRSFIFVNFYFTLFLLTLAFVLLLFSHTTQQKWGVMVFFFTLALSFGILRFHLTDKPAPAFFESRIDQKISLSGKIVDEPDVRENNQKLTVEAWSESEKTKILITTNLSEYFKYGDEINFSGKLEKPENFITDQGKEFDYINYLRKDGIFYVMNYGDIEIISQGGGNFIKSFLFSVKEKFLEKMNLAISSPENLLMGGLILGEKSAFSQELRQDFINTGTIHIIALSGYNVTIVADWFMKLFTFLPKNFGIGMGIFSILLFVLMTGGSSTALRAGMMATLALLARATGRNYDVARALVLAGVLMVLFNPLILVYDVSFQLSFIATFAVIFVSPKFEKYFLWVTPKFGLRGIVSVTVAAYVFVLPFILYKMGNFSLIALPANVLVLPFIPPTMLLGFVTSFLGLIWYPLAVPPGFISYLFLHYELSVIGFLSHLPFSAFTISNFPLIVTILVYLSFIYKFFGGNIKKFLQPEPVGVIGSP